MTKYEPKTVKEQRITIVGSKSMIPEAVVDDLAHCESCLAEALAEKQLLSDQLRQEIADSCQVDMDVRNEAKKVLTWQQVDGDSYAVPDVVEIVAMLVAEVERLKWQPIETAPKGNLDRMLVGGEGFVTVAWWCKYDSLGGGNWLDDGRRIVSGVTHWMPLPKEPNQ